MIIAVTTWADIAGVALPLAVALSYLARRAYLRWKRQRNSDACGGGCTGCATERR